MPLLHETKPKKAKWGFAQKHAGNSILDIGVLIRSTLGTPPPPPAEPYKRGANDPWWEEVTSNMGTIGYLVYINDEPTYLRLKAAIEAS